MKTIGQPILSDNTRAVAAEHQGLAFWGIVSTYTDANNCMVSGLAGKGDGFFEGYYLWCVRDNGGAGAAPQGERARITSYTSSDGSLTHNTFTTILAEDDEVLLLHPILVEAIDAGGYSGDIEIFDSFEYPTVAALRSVWIEGGGAGDPTRSVTAYEGQYSMQTVVAVSVGHIYRLLPTRNMKTLASIGIASQSSAGGDTFRFTLYDSDGNYSYFTQTCNGVANTWTYHNINPHSTPDGGSATPADLSDIVEIRLANLTASSTYKFDFIRFSSLVASMIGIGYDGLDDAVEEASSVRGHLLFINDNIGVPAKDATADALARDVVGKKEDDAQTTVGTTRSLMAYLKGTLNEIAVANSGLARTGIFYFVGKGGDDANDGKSWANRRLTVASGYGLCVSGDTLVIGPGMFTEDINFNTDGVFVIGRGQGLDGTTISGNSTMTCRSNRFEDIFFYDTAGTVVKVGADADANYNEFPNCRIGGSGSAIDIHIDGSVAGGGSFNIFDKCNFYDATQASVLIDGGAATGNIFRNCRARPTTNGHGIHVNHASALRNTFLDCIVVGNSSGGTGIYFQAGLANIAANCHVDDITTPYNIAATNHIVGCHEGSVIAANNTTEDDLKTLYDGSVGDLSAVNRAAGKLQPAATTIDLNLGAATYTLFTGTTQAVVLESLVIRMPDVDISLGALTSISIQTDDVTPAVIISATDGALANLTGEATISWRGDILIPVGTLVQLTIAGGAAGACTCDVVAKSRAVVNLGHLA